jgi:hypothetical protein
MAIIRKTDALRRPRGGNALLQLQPSASDATSVSKIAPIPFAPAFDLLEAQEKKERKDRVAAVIGLALANLLPSEPRSDALVDPWLLQARINALMRRF